MKVSIKYKEDGSIIFCNPYFGPDKFNLLFLNRRFLITDKIDECDAIVKNYVVEDGKLIKRS